MKIVKSKNPFEHKSSLLLQKIIANFELPEKERSLAISVMGKSKNQQNLQFLMERLAIQEELLKEQIIWAIGELGGVSSYNFLKSILSNAGIPSDLRLAAAMSLNNMGHETEVAPVMAMLHNKLSASRKPKKPKEQKEPDVIPFAERGDRLLIYLIGNVTDDTIERLKITIGHLCSKMADKSLYIDFSEVTDFRLTQLKLFHIYLLENPEFQKKIFFVINSQKLLESITKSSFFREVKIIEKLI